MSCDPLTRALNDLEYSIGMMESAEHSLALMLEDMHEENPEWRFRHLCHCILYTLESAVEQSRAGFDIVWEATKGKAA